MCSWADYTVATGIRFCCGILRQFRECLGVILFNEQGTAVLGEYLSIFISVWLRITLEEAGDIISLALLAYSVHRNGVCKGIWASHR